MKIYITSQSEFLHDLRLHMIWRSDVFEYDFIKLLMCPESSKRETWKHEIADSLHTLHGVPKKKHIKNPSSDMLFKWLYTEQYPELSDSYKFEEKVKDICFMENLNFPDNIDRLHACTLHCLELYCKWLSHTLIETPYIKNNQISDKLDEIVGVHNS